MSTQPKDHPGPTVVVTHTAPSLRSVPDRWKSDILAAAYASSIADDLLGAIGAEAVVDGDCTTSFRNVHPRVDFWLHGHIHARSDYVIGGDGCKGCRVICNARGHDDEVPDSTRLCTAIRRLRRNCAPSSTTSAASGRVTVRWRPISRLRPGSTAGARS